MSTPESRWRRTLLHIDATISQAIDNLNDTGLQIVIIINSDNTFAGTITDGDIRRAILRGETLDSPVIGVMCESPLIVSPQMSDQTVKHFMLINHIKQIPVIDENKQVVGLNCWDDISLPRTRPNKVIIMAGGFGKRLRPQTENCPKPMLRVSGKPMLEHIIMRAKQNGFHNFVISIQYLGHMIVDYFGNGSDLGVDIEYLREDKPLGTAGALSNLQSRPEHPFIVTNGDVLSDIKYNELIDYHLDHSAFATMAVRRHEWTHPFGVVKTDGINILSFEEKPTFVSYVNAGIYVLDPGVLGFMEAGTFCDMPNLFERLLLKDKITTVYPMHEPWLDVGRHKDLDLANQKIAKVPVE